MKQIAAGETMPPIIAALRRRRSEEGDEEEEDGDVPATFVEVFVLKQKVG